MDYGPLSIFILNILVGAILLTAGRQFFWLFVGCIGFAAGLQYAPELWNISSPTLLILVSIMTGIVGAVLALVFQKIAIFLAGFAGGGYIAINLLSFFDINLEKLYWIPYLLGGVLGAFFLFLLFEWALIIGSSFAGAVVIIQTVNFNPQIELWGGISLFVFGILVQTLLYFRARTATYQKKRQIRSTVKPEDS